MKAISDEGLKQIFLEARTFSHWLPQNVSDEDLRKIYDLMKWGPTSANLCPVRILFVKNGPEKEKFLECIAPLNVDKVKEAPVTAVIAMDEKFYEKIGKLYPQALAFGEKFAADKALADATMFRNSSLEGGYFILAARALGFDCGPMSGFDNKKLDEMFFAGSSWKSNFICNVGYGDRGKLHPRLERLGFEEACRIV